MSTKPYQEEEGSTFESDGVQYDLNFLFRATAHLPILTIKVNRLKWIVDPHAKLTAEDERRIEAADLDTPLLVLNENSREVTVDGYHRLIKAMRVNRPTLPYRRVSQELMKRAIIPQGEQQARPDHTRW